MEHLSPSECIEIGKIVNPNLSWEWNDHFNEDVLPFYAINGTGNSNELYMLKIYYNDDMIGLIDGNSENMDESLVDFKSNDEIQKIIRRKIQKFNQNKVLIFNQLDKNNDGEVDLVENDLHKLLNKNQKLILGYDANYIHQFVKVSNFIKTKKENTQKIYESIRDTSSQEELEERVSLLKNQIHSYELLVFHSINMMGALVSENLITFYEIYESFDKLGIFNSNWENEVSINLTKIGSTLNEVSDKLANISTKLDELMFAIYNMELNIVNELSNLSYVTQESFEDFNKSVTSQLKEVESSIKTNNLLTGIQAYQLYKINKNTRSLRN